MDYKLLVEKQREYFLTDATKSLSFRIEALKKLYNLVKNNQKLFCDALQSDMRKCPFETYMTEIGMVLDEIKHHIKHIKRWSKDKRVATPLAQFAAKSFVSPHPYGVALIMSPWNYPLQLCLEPLVGAISAGCTAVVKPSAYAPATSAAVAHLIGQNFPSHYIAVVEGGRQQNAALLEQKFDYIFFTGSVQVGKLVMESAAKHLTPMTLELGGKSPVIIDQTADIALAAKRIAFGKVLNAGQTCVAPDYAFIHKSVKQQFIQCYIQVLDQFFPNGCMDDMNTIINQKHFERVRQLIESGDVVAGGKTDQSSLFISPTLLDNVSLDSPIMQEEIFGPVLPLIEYDNLRQCIDYINQKPHPLALYLFTNSKQCEQQVLRSCNFGGGCINDTIIHLATSKMGFGGVGESGMGQYHGKKSFDTFTHYRSIVKKHNWIDLPIRYRPYTQEKEKMVKKFLK